MHRPTPSLADSGLRRLAAGSTLFYVATFAIAVALAGPPVIHDGQEGIEHSLPGRGLLPVFAGMFLLTLGLLALAVAMTFLAQAIGRRGALGALAAQTAWGAGLTYVVVLAGVAFPTGAAGAWALHHDAALSTVLSVNNVRNFAYFAVMPFMGVCSVGLGVAALSDGVLTRWVGWGGIVVGALCLLAVPAAAVGIAYAMPLWLLWWIGVGISLLRHRSVTPLDGSESASSSVTFGHA